MFSNKYDRVAGKWTNKNYQLLKKLGSGGIGEIYLVQSLDNQTYAMKISTDIVSITKEYNYLKKFQYKGVLPKVFELDDFEWKGTLYHYFTMEYIQGYTLKHALKKNMLSLNAKISLICLLTKIIKLINDAGYIYSDLKYENVMIDKKNGLVRLIDMGSITELGSTVKEFTPMYDRMCWGKGNRAADKAYQLFTLAMLLLSLLLGSSFDPHSDKLEVLLARLKKLKLPERVYEAIDDSIQGQIDNCDVFYTQISYQGSRYYNHNRRLNTALNIIIVVLVLALALLGTVFACR